jgi:undecaprenyl pyrophosphate synthase
MAWTAPLYRVYERRLLNSLRPDRLPSHVGVILDGHRRFARAEGLADYTTSYRSGMAKLGELLAWSAQLRLPAVTAWVLSTDNLRRVGHQYSDRARRSTRCRLASGRSPRIVFEGGA